MENTGTAADTTMETGLKRVERNRAEHKRQRAYTWLWSLFVVAMVLTLFFTVWLFGVQVRDNGMAPAVEAGDVILFDRLAKLFQTPARGDILAFSAADGGTCVGRVVALPGEAVAIVGGRVYIGGILLDERAYAMGALPADMQTTALPLGCFFVLPDDRTCAVVDAETLTIEASQIKGRAFMRVSPISRIGIF